MISHKHKCIFIHIPKCAGTSMEVFLKQNAQALGWKKEEGLEYTMRKEGLAKVINLYPHYFTFTFVRNPFDRFVSMWKHSERNQNNKKRTLKEYGKSILENNDEYLSNFDKYHSIKQTKFILDYHPNSFWGVPRKTNDNCDYIGRFENLDNDFAEICRILNIRETKLPNHKIYDSKSLRHYSAYYDDETRQMVEEIYKEDLEYLGYEFETGLFHQGAFLKKQGDSLLKKGWSKLKNKLITLKDYI